MTYLDLFLFVLASFVVGALCGPGYAATMLFSAVFLVWAACLK